VYDANAALKWSYTTNDIVLSSPMAYGGMCIAGSNDYHVYGVDSTTGQLRWKIPTKERVFSSPCIHEFSNTIFIGSYDFNLYAIDHVSGTIKWKYPAGSLIKSSPVVFGDHVFFTSFDKYLYCVNVYTGLTVWKSYMNANSQSSPIVDDLKSGIYSGISGNSIY
jgi:outer membrane protein assembly factor BamB